MLRSIMGLSYRGRFDFLKIRGCFEGDGGQGGGAGAGTGTGAAGGGAGDGGSQGGGTGKNTEPFATFPDEATFMARMKREGKAQLEAMAKSMGFESADAMTAAAKAKAEADLAAKSDLDKEKARADKAEQEVKSTKDSVNRVLVTAEVKVLAVQTGFHDPEDAVALADRSQITVDDNGKVTGAKEALEALAKAKPHLLGKGGGGGSIGGGSNPGGQGGGDPVEEAKKKAEERNKGSQQVAGGYNPWAK